MTPQERAATLYQQLNATVSQEQVCGPEDIKAIRKMECVDICLITAVLQQTRRAALLECLDIARKDGNIIAVRERLTKLAQEGASSIDLSPTIKDDGGYGEHF